MMAQDVGRQGGVGATASSLKRFVTAHLREHAQHIKARQTIAWSAEHPMMAVPATLRIRALRVNGSAK